MAQAKKSTAKTKPKAKGLSCVEIGKLARSPSDADQVTVARALTKRLNKKERLAFIHGVLRVRSLEFVRDVTGVKTTKEAEALIAAASAKLG